jgi:hypothetical protein
MFVRVRLPVPLISSANASSPIHVQLGQRQGSRDLAIRAVEARQPMEPAAADPLKTAYSLDTFTYSATTGQENDTVMQQMRSAKSGMSLGISWMPGLRLNSSEIIVHVVFKTPYVAGFGEGPVCGRATGCLAESCELIQPTTRKKHINLTSTTGGSLSSRINNIRQDRGARPKLKCPLESIKRGLHARNRFENECRSESALCEFGCARDMQITVICSAELRTNVPWNQQIGSWPGANASARLGELIN